MKEPERARYRKPRRSFYLLASIAVEEASDLYMRVEPITQQH